MMTPEAGVRVRVTRHFAASAEHVFDAWLDPVKARHFLFATPAGHIVRCEIDPRVGGRYAVVDRRDGEDVEHTGEYLEIDRPRRFGFTLSVPKYGQDVSSIFIDIVPLESGCELTLTHHLDPALAEFTKRAEEGWKGILEGLAGTVG